MRDIQARLWFLLIRRKHVHDFPGMGIPHYLIENPKTEMGAMWKLTYRTMRWRKRKYPELQWRIAGLDWITDKPKKEGKKNEAASCS